MYFVFFLFSSTQICTRTRTNTHTPIHEEGRGPCHHCRRGVGVSGNRRKCLTRANTLRAPKPKSKLRITSNSTPHSNSIILQKNKTSGCRGMIATLNYRIFFLNLDGYLRRAVKYSVNWQHCPCSVPLTVRVK